LTSAYIDTELLCGTHLAAKAVGAVT